MNFEGLSKELEDIDELIVTSFNELSLEFQSIKEEKPGAENMILAENEELAPSTIQGLGDVVFPESYIQQAPFNNRVINVDPDHSVNDNRIDSPVFAVGECFSGEMQLGYMNYETCKVEMTITGKDLEGGRLQLRFRFKHPNSDQVAVSKWTAEIVDGVHTYLDSYGYMGASRDDDVKLWKRLCDLNPYAIVHRERSEYYREKHHGSDGSVSVSVHKRRVVTDEKLMANLKASTLHDIDLTACPLVFVRLTEGEYESEFRDHALRFRDSFYYGVFTLGKTPAHFYAGNAS